MGLNRKTSQFRYGVVGSEHIGNRSLLAMEFNSVLIK